MDLAITQKRNTAFIEQNSLLLLNILKITKELAKDCGAICKIYQAEEVKKFSHHQSHNIQSSTHNDKT